MNAAPNTLQQAVHAIKRPYLYQGWYCVDMSDGHGVGFETRAEAMKYYREHQKRPS